MRPSLRNILGLLVLLTTAESARAVEAKKNTVLLMTSPRVGELMNIAALVERGWLKVEGLKLIGIHHAQEWTDYRSAHAYLAAEAPDWMEIVAIDCDLSAATVFGSNGCTAEFERLFQESDGIFFTGGPDIPPGLYGQQTRLTTVIGDPPRHLFEISFLSHLLLGDKKAKRKALLDSRPAYMVVGLCLGMQTMNVATGGTLWQDIPSQIYGLRSLEAYDKLKPKLRHRSAQAQLSPGAEVGWGNLHPVQFRDHPLSRKLLPDFKNPVLIFSLHHQAAHKLGHGLRALATTTDGRVIEALVHKRYPAVLGVQFHPEKRIVYDKTITYRAKEGDPVKNFAAQAMGADERAMGFHRRFWEVVSGWLIDSARAR